jgi:hypothetical protein
VVRLFLSFLLLYKVFYSTSIGNTTTARSTAVAANVMEVFRVVTRALKVAHGMLQVIDL